jgi:dihydrofolate synthase/folylpolyglutamate synthase
VKTLFSRFSDFSAFERYLSGLGLFHMRLSLERMQTAQRRLGISSPPLALVQIVGTNGKGSTAFFLSQLAQAHGLRTGLFTSPHFLSFLERIRLNGRPALPEQILRWANHVLEYAWDLDLTYFELLTLIAMHGFQEENLDLAVLEAGLGGSNDATTAWTPDVLLFTPVGLDHAHIIGPDLEHIARDKAGAIKVASMVVTGLQEPLVMEILQSQAGCCRAHLLTVEEILAGAPAMNDLTLGLAGPGLAGEHQVHNARLALAGWLPLCGKKQWRVDLASCRVALSSASWPGRLQRIAGPPDIILDGAHNAPALQTLARSLEALGIRPGALVFNCMRDKDLMGMVPWVRRLTSGPIFVPDLPTYERARPARETAAILEYTAQPAESVAAALHKATLAGDPVLICGSLYLLAEVYRLHPRWIEDF